MTSRGPWIIAADARRFRVMALRLDGTEREFSRHVDYAAAYTVARKLARQGLRTRVADLLAEDCET